MAACPIKTEYFYYYKLNLIMKIINVYYAKTEAVQKYRKGKETGNK